MTILGTCMIAFIGEARRRGDADLGDEDRERDRDLDLERDADVDVVWPLLLLLRCFALSAACLRRFSAAEAVLTQLRRFVAAISALNAKALIGLGLGLTMVSNVCCLSAMGCGLDEHLGDRLAASREV